MNRAEQILRKGGTWMPAESMFDEPPTDAPRPVLEHERPRTCQQCGAPYALGKGRSATLCGRCLVRSATEAASAKRNPGRFGVARREA